MSEERRERYRCISPEDAQSAVLRSGKKECPVRLIDQSAEGFAVAATGLRARVGKKLLIRTNQCWSEVEVIRREKAGKETILGLKQLRELPDPRQVKAINASSLSVLSFGSRATAGTKAGAALWVAAGTILVFWAYVLGTALGYFGKSS